MSATLRGIGRQEDVVIAVAADLGSVTNGRDAQWHDAVAAYLARRKRDLLHDIMDAPDVENRKRRLTAIEELGALVSEQMTADPPDIFRREDGQSRQQHQIALAYLLTPLGWRDRFLPALDEWYRLCEAKIIEGTDTLKNQALGSEIDRFRQFLVLVEKQGRDARVDQERAGRAVTPARHGQTAAVGGRM